MKKLLCCLCLLLAAVCMLAGCGEDDTPPDFQLASDPEKDGFTLYIPEEWSYNRANGVVSAYVSSLNTATVTVARLDTDMENMEDYWSDAETELADSLNNYAFVSVDDAAVVDGYAAYCYEYTGDYLGLSYRFRQYLILLGDKPSDGMLAITYSATSEANSITGKVDFDEGLEKFGRVLQVFKVGSGVAAPAGDLSVEDENAPDGMKNATRNKYLDMTVYVPQDWRVDLSDGFIGAVTPDGIGNVGISAVNLNSSVAGNQSTLTQRLEHYGIELYDPEGGFTLIDYWNLLKAEYGDYFTDSTFHVVEEPRFEADEGGEKTPPAVAGQTTYYRFVFTGSHGGKCYRVSLYLFRETSDRKNRFRTLTYTTQEESPEQDDNHQLHLSEVERILAEVRY